MVRKIFSVFLLLSFFLGICTIAIGEISSTNFRIKTSTFSGGGETIGSNSYKMNSSIGQVSPLMEPADPPFSDSYDLYPGFWYTVANIVLACSGDFNGDRDVDGSDLAEYLFDAGGLGLDAFAENFGKDNCP